MQFGSNSLGLEKSLIILFNLFMTTCSVWIDECSFFYLVPAMSKHRKHRLNAITLCMRQTVLACTGARVLKTSWWSLSWSLCPEVIKWGQFIHFTQLFTLKKMRGLQSINRGLQSVVRRSRNIPPPGQEIFPPKYFVLVPHYVDFTQNSSMATALQRNSIAVQRVNQC